MKSLIISIGRSLPIVGIWVSLLGLVACSSPNAGSDGLVADIAAFNEAVQAAEPGDRIVLANGTWEDVELVFTGTGTAEAPITLSVEEKGKVVLVGQSNISISGEYLVVEGLVFKEGYTPTSEVISLKTSKEDLCNHCRVTECVIDNYSNPERFESDYWVGIYGKNNRFDHNYLSGKSNQGVTLAVRLNSEASRENNHRIDHNYFGYNPILGSNGGESLRIGTSHYAHTNSNTLVEANYFYRCNGEHEIISNKSGQNIFRDNTFYESQGTLTMRHGNETLVENNYFFGNGRANTGGIRIINEKQKVINNYCEGLTGHRFRGALVIMNGVPNSPPNRYMPVIESEASQNVFIDCDHIQFGAGSDAERSAAPQTTVFAENVISHSSRENVFTVWDDISGITFRDNLLSPGLQALQPTGFVNQELTFEEVDGLKIPTGTVAGDRIREGMSKRATPDNTGVDWYPRPTEKATFGTGNTIAVAAGTNTLLDAARQSAPGDVIELQEAGVYLLTKAIDVPHPLTFSAKARLNEKPVLQFQRTSLFNIENGGALRLSGLHIDGKECDDKPGNAVVRTSRYSMNQNYKLFVEDCTISDLDVNHSFNVLRIFKNTFADSIVLRNSVFTNISGAVLALAEEKDDIGIYNVEDVVVNNCVFQDVEGAAIHLHRGGGDESTFGPILRVDHSTFQQVGQGKRNKSGGSIALHGVQDARIQNSLFDQSAPIDLHLTVGDPITQISHCNFSQTPPIVANDDSYETSQLTTQSPTFVGPNSYQLAADADLRQMGINGTPIGYHKK